ncbi:HEXXH motif-containing putative peptide modification protein [Streptomyces sp. YS415]|uniref:aKG-HExxH-type peptide beta-hydroxylase n=1 Tax=Streptomyces sp. YS415 TaxID=2944806 RepID=UPI002022103B|nr:HEXXH motif-containing putative peptide modification protein [Streptomyces sp. YS415]MCL7427047.1 HEXXH motif-containing putative peptide modification protein [Streptomyces sp. YS415]
MHVVFMRRLTRIAGTVPEAGRLLDALDGLDAMTLRPVMGDTALRCAIQHATWRVERGWQGGLGPDLCADLFRETTALLEQGCTRAPLEFGAARPDRLGLEHHSGWIWNNEHADDPALRAFQDLVKQNYDAFLCSPNKEEIEGLRQGAQLLTELMPRLSRSALSHTHVVGICPQEGRWKGSASSSQFRLTGTIFLDRASVSDPWWVVEHMFHEALHQKLYDFRHGHTLFEPYDPSREGRTIQSPWNSFAGDSNRWDAFRAFAAFHVYVHLALLGALVEQRHSELRDEDPGPAGPIRVISSRKAIDRARYLGDALRSICWDQLGAAGKRFHQWLTDVLDVLDPAPGRADAYVHLLLDLYRNETSRVSGSVDADSAEILALATEEAEATRSLLHDLAASEEEVRQFNATVSHHLGSGTATAHERFREIRSCVSAAIQSLCRDGHHIEAAPGHPDPNETVWRMIQRSSERINVLLAPRKETLETVLTHSPRIG